MSRAREIADLVGGTTPDIILKTADGAILNLQTSDTTVTDGSVLGAINFTAPNEASGTDAITIGGAILAVAEGTFAADNNATELVFMTGASEAATSKMVLSSGGNLTVTGVGTFASLDISGDIDVDGTTNLDIVDIDGAVNMATTALVTGVLTTTAVPLFNGGIDLPTVNTFIKGGGHDVIQVDSTRTYFYGGTNGVQFRTADNAAENITFSNTGAAVFNEQSNDADFRVESNNRTHMLFVDGGSDYVAIGSADQNNGGALNLNAVSGSTVSTMTTRSATDAHTNIFTMLKTPATSGNYTATASGDVLGDIRFMGVNTSAVADIGARIQVEQTGTASGTVPAKMVFVTNESTRMAIDANGSIGIGVDDGDVTSDGTAARKYVAIIGTGNRGRLNLGSTAVNGADSGVLSFVNGANELGNINMETNSGVQNAGKMYISATSSIYIQGGAGEVVFNESGNGSSNFRIESDTNANMFLIDSGDNTIAIGTTVTSLATQNTQTGVNFTHVGRIFTCNTDHHDMNVQDDGEIIRFRSAANNEGNINVSGSTVALTGFSGRHESSGVATDTVVGTVVSTIDELDIYAEGSGPKAGQIRYDHAKIKVSDTAGDKRVYGVIANFDEYNSPIVAALGIAPVRVTGSCAGGDLLESNGDGTAKVQSDDIVRSKTIGKVTVGNDGGNSFILSGTNESSADAGSKILLEDGDSLLTEVLNAQLTSCVMYCG